MFTGFVSGPTACESGNRSRAKPAPTLGQRGCQNSVKVVYMPLPVAVHEVGLF